MPHGTTFETLARFLAEAGYGCTPPRRRWFLVPPPYELGVSPDAFRTAMQARGWVFVEHAPQPTWQPETFMVRDGVIYQPELRSDGVTLGPYLYGVRGDPEVRQRILAAALGDEACPPRRATSGRLKRSQRLRLLR